MLGAFLAIRLGLFVNGDTWSAIVTGMTLVSAMAIQNAVHRIHLGTAPPTTLMTGTTTQIMIDLADAIRGLSPDARAITLFRLRHMSVAVLTFAFGAAAAACLFSQFGSWCFVVPPMVALAARLSANSAQTAPPLRLAAPVPRPSS